MLPRCATKICWVEGQNIRWVKGGFINTEALSQDIGFNTLGGSANLHLGRFLEVWEK